MRGDAIFIEPANRHRETFVYAANQEEACIGIIVNDGGHEKETDDTDCGDVTEKLVQPHIYDSYHREESASCSLSLNCQQGKRCDQVGSNNNHGGA